MYIENHYDTKLIDKRKESKQKVKYGNCKLPLYYFSNNLFSYKKKEW